MRIGIDDTIVDYTQRGEFGDRVKTRDGDGADLSYYRPLGDLPGSDVSACRANPSCQLWASNSQGDAEARNRWVQQIVAQDGWPTRDDSVFVLDGFFAADGSIEQLFRWSEIPTPYDEGNHGTIVASIAAGTNLGVAPNATIIPIANNLTNDQSEEAVAGEVLQLAIQSLPTADRRQFDEIVARTVRESYEKFDIINRSYGMRTDRFSVGQTLDEVEWLQAYLPRNLRADWQIDRPDSEKTIIVYAAGNDSDPVPGLGALLPYGIPDLRGHTLAVVATDSRTGMIHPRSNWCGPQPDDWNATRHGPHYCLAAPGTVRGLDPNPNTPGQGDTEDGLFGTSFAAPLVSGALALLMEHFRGTRGNTEVVKRMLDTADRSGRYADLETYGAGHLDLEAALSPVGTLSLGQSARGLYDSSLQVPAIFGSITNRVEGLELTAFDEQNFPFWVPLSSRVRSGTAIRSTIPMFQSLQRNAAPAPGFESMGMNWTPIQNTGNLGLPEGHDYVIGFGRHP